KVYTRGGLEALERGVRTVPGPISHDAAELVRKTVLPLCRDDLAGELWYDPEERLPITTTPDVWWQDFTGVNARLAEHAVAVMFGPGCANVVPAPRFNRVCDETASKAAVLSAGLVELLRETAADLGPAQGPPEPVVFLCDKQGGRNYYAALVQQAFPDGWVVAEKESAAESRYRVERLDRTVSVTFRPRADAESVAVALASMLCKYLREV